MSKKKQNADKKVRIIEADPELSKKNDANRILKVAAYCRVSTDDEDQLNSFYTQMAYYTEYIKRNPRWRFAGIYADDGITGTQVKKRDEFLRMIDDCEKGKIDLIITKSVSRYARNIVDCISYIRKLKELGMGIYFEEQNINSLTEDSEVYIGIYGVLAQSESENISANVKWGINKRMQNGTYNCRFNLLGYRRDKETKEIYIVPEEAEVVKMIFQMYLQGKSLGQIKAYLESNEIKTINGKSVWDKSTVKGILINEKYIGDVIFLKTYREDCIRKKSKINRGEVDRYLIMDNHPAIIDRETFNLVRKEMVRRSSKRRSSDRAITELGKYSGKYALSELLACDICGGPFRRKTWSRKGFKKIYWRCLRHTENGDDGCPQARGIEETVLHDAICRGLTNCIPETGEVKKMVALMLACATSKDKMLMEWQEVQKEIKELMRKAEAAETMCFKTQGNKEPYMEQIKKDYASIARLREQDAELKKKLERNEEFQTELKQIGEWIEADEISYAEYNDDIVRYLVERIYITEDFKLVINMKGGDTVVEEIYPIE